MTHVIVFIHGAGDDAHVEDAALVNSLRAALGAGHDVRYPPMPDAARPTFAAWSAALRREIARAGERPILVGHSLGGSVLLKHLAQTQERAAGLFLLAPPYWGAPGWEVDEFALDPRFDERQLGALPVFLYHARDDEVVPFEHLSLYRRALPGAVARELDRQGHQFVSGLSALANDVRALASASSRDREAR